MCSSSDDTQDLAAQAPVSLRWPGLAPTTGRRGVHCQQNTLMPPPQSLQRSRELVSNLCRAL